jgi:hypothetical protein
VQADAVTLANTTGILEKLETRDQVYKMLSAQGVLGKSDNGSDFERNFAAPDVGALSDFFQRKGATDGACARHRCDASLWGLSVPHGGGSHVPADAG